MGLVELRDIEIFLTLAEELHFGRTSERLHVSVARVSQAIKKQERAIGAELFARNSHSVRLTRLGEQLRDDLRHLHQGLTHSLERARLAARGKTGTLRVSLFPANIQELRRYFETFRARHPQWELRLRVSALPGSVRPATQRGGRHPGHLAAGRGARPNCGSAALRRAEDAGRGR
ncbi:LysR family transcriptional regulator [Nonomuraea dietziae]